MKKLNVNIIFLTVLGVGFIPFASGTFGSLAGVFFGYIINIFSFNIFYFLIPILFIFGVIGSNIYENKTGKKDSSIIVIDEVVGQLIAMMPIINNNFLIILSFFIFRLFDIYKPWPASYFDKNIKGGLGVMLDDVVAGIYTAIIVYLLSLII